MTHLGDVVKQQQVRTYSQENQITWSLTLSKLLDLDSAQTQLDLNRPLLFLKGSMSPCGAPHSGCGCYRPMVPSGALSAPVHPLASSTDMHDAVLGPLDIAVQEGATTQGQDQQPHQQSHNKARSFPITPFLPKLLLLSGKFLLIL